MVYHPARQPADDQAMTATRPRADPAIIEALHAEHGGILFREAVHLTGGDRGRAEDLVQETLLRAWTHPQAFTAGSPRPWLFTTLRHLATDAWRARQTRPPEAAPAILDYQVTDDGTDRLLNTVVVMGAVTALKEDHRRVLAEVYYRDRTTAEAAAVLGVAEGTVKSRTHYALRALRVALQDRDQQPERRTA